MVPLFIDFCRPLNGTHICEKWADTHLDKIYLKLQGLNPDVFLRTKTSSLN